MSYATKERRNQHARERYATDPEYRERELERRREGRRPEVESARRRRWRAQNPEKARAAYRRDNERRRMDPRVRADAVERVRRWRIANPDHHLHLQVSRYGITAADYRAMLEQQGGVCFICRQPERPMPNGRLPRLAVDHDHTTGAIRALLCRRCNHLIGAVNEDPSLLVAARDYLEAFKA